MHRDRYDLPLTTSSERAAAHYRDGMDCMLSAWHGAGDAFDRAIAEDNAFALAHIARARVHVLNMQASEAQNMAARARQLAVNADARERQHIAIMAAAIEGNPKAATSGAEAHLEQFPRDALVLSLLLGAFGLYAFSGRPDHDAARVAVCERAATHYGEDWWFTGYLGWSHTEAGSLSTGRALSERSIGLRAANGNGAHGLAHVMFEQGDTAVGREFLSKWLPAHNRKSFLNGHLWWHLALTALDDGDSDTALAVYEQEIKPADRPYPPLNVFTDCASLLWRLALAGKTGLEPHWHNVAAYGDKYFPQAGAHFADVHHALLAAATGGAPLDTRLAQMEARAADGKLAPGRIAIDLCRGMRAFTEGDHDGAIRLLEPAMADLVRIGGSHAQRQLWEDTLIVAYLRGGHAKKAAGLISTRLEQRPSARDLAWSHATQSER